ncbi:Armadillo-type fold containing protein [Parasponia andersonii]|uniref:Armadillo-type fold containing protein n=1 Tax=Parasponia andersonii TaxID=3476 RepID=A0A2P5B3A8_PARAD|nr:Armadillo-type fold containing protein [Parasponia andersonii]
MGRAELGKSQEKMSPDWEQAFNRFESVIASGTEATRLEVITKLAHLSKCAPEYVLAHSIPILARLLEEDSLDNSRRVQEVAAYCLYRIACHGEGELAMEIGLSGVITSLVRLLPHSDDSFMRVLIKSLWSLVTFGIENRVVVARNGGLEIIIDLLNSSTDAVSSGSMVSRERACQAIGLIGVMRRARRMLVNLGVIPVLVELFCDGDTTTELVAGNSLGVISAHIDYIRPVAEAGAIPLYAELFQGPELSGKEIAEDAFCILAVDEGNAVVIVEHLVRILREGDDEARTAAADVLWDLLGYKHSVFVVLLSGAIPVLVDLLSDGNQEVKEKVSGAIAHLSYDEANRAALADAGAIPFLMELLHDESEESRDNAAEALVNFSDDPLQHNRMSEAMLVPSFQNMQNRLTDIRASENYLARSTRWMSIEQLIQNPDLV